MPCTSEPFASRTGIPVSGVAPAKQGAHSFGPAKASELSDGSASPSEEANDGVWPLMFDGQPS